MIIINRHRPFFVAQCLQSRLLCLCGQCQRNNAAGLSIVIHAIQQIVSGDLRGIMGQGRGADAAIPVSQPMHRCFPQRFHIGIASAVPQSCQQNILPVHNNTAVQIAAAVHMGRAGKHSPVIGIRHKFRHEKREASHQQQNEQQNDPRAARDPIHPPHLRFCSGVRQSWHSGGYPPP